MEALVAVAIVSVLLLGVMAGMSTSASVSHSTGKVASTRNALASITEQMAAAGWPGCGTPSVVNAAMHDTSHAAYVEAPAGFEFTVTDVSSAYPEAATCQTSPATTAVRLTVTVTAVGSSETLTGEVVIRNREARPA